MPKSQKKSRPAMKMPRLQIRRSKKGHEVLIDGEVVDFPILKVELEVTSDTCSCTFVVPLESMEIAADDLEFKLRVVSPENYDEGRDKKEGREDQGAPVEEPGSQTLS